MQAAHTKGAFVDQLIHDAADEFRNALAYPFDCEECSHRAWQHLKHATSETCRSRPQIDTQH
jgi:hypothetical protein